MPDLAVDQWAGVVLGVICVGGLVLCYLKGW